VICVDLAEVGIAQPDKVLFDDLSLTISTGERLAIVGVNGSGKSTLMRLLAGTEQPDEGDVRFGRGVRIALLDQDPLLPPGTVSEYLGDSWEVAAVATSLGVQPLLDRPTDELSGGQAKRVALARTLVGEFDMILLDEPTNHLDLEAIEWLERRLAGTTAALVMITHDRHLMDRLTTARGSGRVMELERGTGHVHRAEAGTSAYAAYLTGRTARLEHAASAEASRRILARRELEWLRRGAQARSTKPKARLRAAREIVAGGPGAAGVRGADLLLDMGSTRLGNQVVELTGVAQTYRDHTVFREVDLLIEPGARLGVVGPNGSGKSTLIDIIAGRREPGFDATAQFAPVRLLSGGERRRLQLVMVLATKPNLLVLDEPTNDLDLDTLRALESFLDDWPGALVVASHDRIFLDRTVDHVLAIDERGELRRVPGGVHGWLASRAEASTSSESRARPRRAATKRAGSGSASRYTVGRQMRDIEQAMEKVQRRVDDLQADLDAADGHEALASLGAELADAQAELSSLEDGWLELAEQLPG